jgi:glyoxylase-like metal-dependent hydrolase (beta-lactamase superfamily II)
MSRAVRAADGIWWMRTLIVNVAFVSSREGWVLVDAGMGGYSGSIAAAAGELFGTDRGPDAIVLTHGHFDHVGSLEPLLDRWDVPVYAHSLELPYITGASSYPPPDPLVGGGAMAWSAKLYPRGPIDVDGRTRPLPEDGRVPGLPDWRWMHSPGHSPGHVSLVRERDGAVIAGDAITTTRQESLISVMTQRQEVHGPPAYFTPDWFAAARSVRALAALAPCVLVSGHGIPMSGRPLHDALFRLADRFERDEVPARGRYVGVPALSDDRGTVWLPPDPFPAVLARVAVPVALGAAALLAVRRRRTPRQRHVLAGPPMAGGSW